VALNDIMGGGQYDAYTQGQNEQQANLASLLKNQTTAAELPGVTGRSQSLAAAGQLAEAGTPGAIKEQASTQQTQMSANQIKQLADAGGMMSQVAGIMKNMPVDGKTGEGLNSRAKFFASLADKFGMSEDNPIRQEILKADPNDMPDIIAKHGNDIQTKATQQVQQQALWGTRGANAASVAQIKASSNEEIQATKADTAKVLANLNNTSKEGIAANALTLKKIMFDNKVVNPEQLVAKRTQEYQAEQTPERLEALKQATDLATALNNAKGLPQAYQQANIGANLLGNELAPNTIAKPNLNPTASFPTGGPGLTSPAGQAPVASMQVPTPKAAPAVAKPVQVGTQGGKPVYTNDPANPQDKSKWHY